MAPDLHRWALVGHRRGRRRGRVRRAADERLADELRVTEERYRFLADNTSDVLFVLDTATLTIEYVSPSVLSLAGYSPEELIGRDLGVLLTPEARERAVDSARDQIAAAAEGAQRTDTYLAYPDFVHKDGRLVPVEVSVKVLGGQGGTPLQHISVARDISIRKSAEHMLRESEERYRLIADNIADVIWVMDFETQRFAYISPSVKRLRGYTAEEAMTQTLGESLTPESYAKVTAIMQRKMQEILDSGGTVLPEPVTAKVLQPCKDGRTVVTEITARVLPGAPSEPPRILGVTRDITPRDRVEMELRESRKRLEDLLLVIGDFIWEADRENRYTICSEGVRKMLGYAPEEVIGKHPWDFMPPEDAEFIREHATKLVETGEGCTGLVSHSFHRDGHIVVSQVSCVPVFDDAGQLTGFRGVDKDITEATAAQESLRISVKELNALWKIAETVASPGDLEDTLRTAAGQIAEALGAPIAGVATFGEGDEGRHTLMWTGDDTDPQLDLLSWHTYEYLSTISSEDVRAEPRVYNDLSEDPLPHQIVELAQTVGIGRLLVVPLVLQAGVIGVLSVARTTDAPPYSDREVEFVQTAMSTATAAIVHARLRAEEQTKTVSLVREHLARELHDAVTQSVYSANLIAQALPVIWERDQQEGLAGLDQLRRLVRSALAELRILLYELRPASLAGVELDQLLARLADSLAGQADLEIDIETHMDVPLPHDVKIVFYRIAQEAFNNIHKHAKAQNVSVKAISDEKGASLSVKDDGIGADTHTVTADHLGLSIMRERAQEVSARFEIRRLSPSGTEVLVDWTR